jgi:hypothetical protein
LAASWRWLLWRASELEVADMASELATATMFPRWESKAGERNKKKIKKQMERGEIRPAQVARLSSMRVGPTCIYIRTYVAVYLKFISFVLELE